MQRGLFEANPHFSDAVNGNIIRSEIEGGVYLKDLPPGSALSIETSSRVYEMVVLSDGAALLSGHPEFCPEPTEVRIQGSTWGGSMLKANFVGDTVVDSFLRRAMWFSHHNNKNNKDIS